jgi:enoyl-ACP reductase-like protein
VIPYGRLGQPEDIGRAAAWLVSDDADYVHGQTLFVPAQEMRSWTEEMQTIFPVAREKSRRGPRRIISRAASRTQRKVPVRLTRARYPTA